jgi:hypothetical protein
VLSGFFAKNSDFGYLVVTRFAVSNRSMARRIALIVSIAIAFGVLQSAGAPLLADEKGSIHSVRPTELSITIGHADAIVVYDSTPAISRDGTDVPSRILYSSAAPKDISELGQAIVVEPPRNWFRCACYPPIEIVLSRSGKEIGVISVYEELTIGFSRWSGDARIASQERLLKWFDARGITAPRRAIEQMRARERTERAASERWLSAMPSSFRPLWPKLMKNPDWWSSPPLAVAASVKALEPELEKEFPDPNERVLELLSWFGSGAGPWSGFPAYEDVAAQLLLEQQQSAMLAALRDVTLTESELEGAARFFSGYCYDYLYCPPEENRLPALLPDELKRVLLRHVLKDADEDKLGRFRHAFGASQPRGSSL